MGVQISTVVAGIGVGACVVTYFCGTALGISVAGDSGDLVAAISLPVRGARLADEVLDTSKAARAARLAVNRKNGIIFQAAVTRAFRFVGGTENFSKITVVIRGGKVVTTIPDLVGRNVGGLLEIKDVLKLSLSPQLRAQIQHANLTGQPLNLIVSQRTQSVSGPLLQAVRGTGGDAFRFNRSSGEFTPF